MAPGVRGPKDTWNFLADNMANVVYFIFGNHGNSPAQIEDYLDYLRSVAIYSGVEIRFSRELVPNAHNLILECFDEQSLFQLKDCKEKYPETRIACLCSEVITGNTFNNFASLTTNSDPLVDKRRPHSLMKSAAYWLTPPIVRFAAKKFLLRSLRGGAPDVVSNYYNDGSFWTKRYKNFLSAVGYFDEVWYLIPFQRDEFVKLLGQEKVHHLPIAGFPNRHRTEQAFEILEKDIDFLFTGTVTPYRAHQLNRLRSHGYNVVSGSAALSGVIRDQYIARTKICVHVKHAADWYFPSIMRLHHMLSIGAPIVAERAVDRCPQESFVVSVDSVDFVKTCCDLIESGKYKTIGPVMHAEYIEGSKAERERASSILKNFLCASTWNQSRIPIRERIGEGNLGNFN